MTAPHELIVQEGLECEAERYAEVKAITEGETSVVGSMHGPCVQHLTRNLDVDPELGPGLGKILYDVFPLQISPEALAEADAALSAHPRGSLLIHLGEGAPHDAAAAREFAMLKGRGLLRPGVILIHGVAITPEEFGEMAAAGVGLVWSPRSNVELYGDTADVAAAKAAGVTIALAPDWSPTGSVGSLGELNYASMWNQTQTPPPFTEKELVMMATANAAKLVNLSGEIGSLAPGHAADLIVLRNSDQEGHHDAYWTITHCVAAGPGAGGDRRTGAIWRRQADAAVRSAARRDATDLRRGEEPRGRRKAFRRHRAAAGPGHAPGRAISGAAGGVRLLS